MEEFLHNFHPHDVQQWSAELGKSNGWERWLPLTMVGSKLRVPGHCGGWQYQRVVCKIFTHATRDSGAENLVDQMGRNVGLPLTMVGSGLRVPGNCNIWQH
jgi:hypothetical protein